MSAFFGHSATFVFIQFVLFLFISPNKCLCLENENRQRRIFSSGCFEKILSSQSSASPIKPLSCFNLFCLLYILPPYLINLIQQSNAPSTNTSSSCFTPLHKVYALIWAVFDCKPFYCMNRSKTKHKQMSPIFHLFAPGPTATQ